MNNVFKSHGSFNLSVSNNILIARLSDSWNKECAEDFAINFRIKVNPLLGKSWGHLVFLDNWDLCVPEMLPTITDLVTWCIENGLKKSAQVYDDSMIKKYSIDQMVVKQIGGFERRVFSESDKAMTWLNQYGFKVNENIIHQDVV
jgi:hypothetical protein